MTNEVGYMYYTQPDDSIDRIYKILEGDVRKDVSFIPGRSFSTCCASTANGLVSSLP